MGWQYKWPTDPIYNHKPLYNTLNETESLLKNAPVIKARLRGRKKSFPTCLFEEKNRKIEFKVIRVFSLPVYKSHQHENSSPLATPAYWSGIVCQLKSPQYVTFVLSRLNIHSHFVTLNTYKFKHPVRISEKKKKKKSLYPPLVFQFILQLRSYNLSCLDYML